MAWRLLIGVVFETKKVGKYNISRVMVSFFFFDFSLSLSEQPSIRRGAQFGSTHPRDKNITNFMNQTVIKSPASRISFVFSNDSFICFTIPSSYRPAA